MRPQNLPLLFLAAGVVAAVALSSRRAPPVRAEVTRPAGRNPGRKFVLAKDVPSLELRRGELLRVEPDALIYLGDIVALKSDEPEVILARFHDELMHCVDGLVIRDPQPYPSV